MWAGVYVNVSLAQNGQPHAHSVHLQQRERTAKTVKK
jgi:hypothetical protein